MVKPRASLTFQLLHLKFVTQTRKGHLSQKYEKIRIHLWESCYRTPGPLFGSF